MDELSRHGMFIEITIDDSIHSQSNDVLICRLLLFNFNDINCNEIQHLLVYFPKGTTVETTNLQAG